MSKNLFEDSITAITESEFNSTSSGSFKVLSVRPSNEAAALIDVQTEMNNGKIPLSRLADLISEELAEFTISRKEHIACLQNVIQSKRSVDPKSALGIIKKSNCIKRSRRKFDF